MVIAICYINGTPYSGSQYRKAVVFLSTATGVGGARKWLRNDAMNAVSLLESRRSGLALQKFLVILGRVGIRSARLEGIRTQFSSNPLAVCLGESKRESM